MNKQYYMRSDMLQNTMLNGGKDNWQEGTKECFIIATLRVRRGHLVHLPHCENEGNWDETKYIWVWSSRANIQIQLLWLETWGSCHSPTLRVLVSEADSQLMEFNRKKGEDIMSKDMEVEKWRLSSQGKD